MARNWFTYTIHAEGDDGAMGRELLTYTTKRVALKAARGWWGWPWCAGGPSLRRCCTSS